LKNINSLRFAGVEGRNVGDGLNRLSRRVRIYTPNGPIGGRRCTEQANKKQVVMEHFRGSGQHKYILKNMANMAAKRHSLRAYLTKAAKRTSK
jgi:hypothetical protein